MRKERFLALIGKNNKSVISESCTIQILPKKMKMRIDINMIRIKKACWLMNSNRLRRERQFSANFYNNKNLKTKL